MKKLSRFLLILILLALIFAAISNPSRDEFIDYCKTEYVNDSDSGLEGIISRIAKGAVGTIASQATRHNYVIFSVYDLADAKFVGIYGNFFRLDSN
ncbi:hypothetical protein ACE1ET_15085 [Saccharicrinis sp. FJH62]|uniref:hypothetical protein n=1 Tax=Saccharicrinis sp. FJH62 TaxID=3344657 RepID=UPI0035D4DDF5